MALFVFDARNIIKRMEQVLQSIAQNVEKQLDSEIEKLNQLDSDDLEKIREQRLKELKARTLKKNEWLANGHGEYSELPDEKDFFEASKKSPDMVVHFYKTDSPRCKIVDMHLKLLAKKHVETRFVKVDVERCPFLTGRLKIRIIPTIALVKEMKTKDYIVGFTDLGNCDDFSTELLEWRIAQSGAIEYQGDLLVPPAQARKNKSLLAQSNKTIRSSAQDDDSDLEFSD